MTDQQQVDTALATATVAFWQKVAETFGYETGDFPPDAHVAFEQAARTAIKTWVDWNQPDAADEVVIEIDATEPMELLRSRTPEGVYLRLHRHPTNAWPVVQIKGPRAAVKAFVDDNWGDDIFEEHLLYQDLPKGGEQNA